MDDFTQAALKKYSELSKELESLDARKLTIEGQIKGLITFLQSAEPSSRAELVPVQAWPFPTQTAHRRAFIAKKDVIADRVEKMLKMKQPQMTRHLLEQLGQQGIAMTGSDPVVALSAILSREDRFVANRKDGWSLKEVPDAGSIEDLV